MRQDEQADPQTAAERATAPPSPDLLQGRELGVTPTMVLRNAAPDVTQKFSEEVRRTVDDQMRLVFGWFVDWLKLPFR